LLRSRRTLARTKAAARPAAVGGEARADSFDEGFHLVVVEVIGGGLVGVGGVVVLGGGGGLGGGGDSAAGASRGSGGGLLRALVVRGRGRLARFGGLEGVILRADEGFQLAVIEAGGGLAADGLAEAIIGAGEDKGASDVRVAHSFEAESHGILASVGHYASDGVLVSLGKRLKAANIGRSAARVLSGQPEVGGIADELLVGQVFVDYAL
jgi:hypothetical protein